VPGWTTGSCSRPGPAVRSSRATWSARSTESAMATSSGPSRFITCGTRQRPCSRTSASRPATLRSSSATPGWPSRLRSTPTRTAKPTATHSAASAKHSDMATSCPGRRGR
jgi:hypothetical protein